MKKSTRLSHQVRYQNQNLVYELEYKYLEMDLTSLMNCDSILAWTLFDKLDGESPVVDVEPLNLVVVGLLKFKLRLPGLS